MSSWIMSDDMEDYGLHAYVDLKKDINNSNFYGVLHTAKAPVCHH